MAENCILRYLVQGIGTLGGPQGLLQVVMADIDVSPQFGPTNG